MVSTHTAAAAPTKAKRGGPLAVLMVIGMVAATIVLPAQSAEATHFRSTQLTWEQLTGNTVEFHYTKGVRRSFYWGSAPDGRPQLGDTIGLPWVRHGDGSSHPPQGQVIMVDEVNDWLIAESKHQHTYQDAGSYEAWASECCRLSAPLHRNNPDGNNRISTLVDVGGSVSGSLRSLVSPIVDCPIDATCTFSVPSTGPSDLTRTYRLADSLEASGSGAFVQPGPPHAPAAATIDAGTGQYSWDTTGASLNANGDSYYSTQVILEGRQGGQVVTSTAVDFFIRLTESPNQAPVFEAPTPADGTVIAAHVGSQVRFDVRASDPDAADTVTLNLLGAPADASFAATPGNPGTGEFRWTPTSTGSVILVLTAQDQHGRGALQRSVTIEVVEAPVCAEEGLQSVDLGGLVSGTVHDELEPILVDVDELVGNGSAIAPFVHDLNCDTVVPVEAEVDALVDGLLTGVEDADVEAVVDDLLADVEDLVDGLLEASGATSSVASSNPGSDGSAPQLLTLVRRLLRF